MKETEPEPKSLRKTAAALKSRTIYLIGFGAILFVAAFFVPWPLAQLASVGAGATLITLGAIVWLFSAQEQDEGALRRQVLDEFIANDASPSFTTDLDGEIIGQNRSAKDQFKAEPKDTLGRALRGLFANPAALLNRLESKARARGAAREDVVTRQGHVRLSVHRLGEDALLWRLEEMSDRAHGGRGAETLSLPMMTASKSGTVLFMNEALRRILGGRVRRLDDVFVEPGDVVAGKYRTIRGENNDLQCQVVELTAAGGRREFFLVPVLDAGDQESGPDRIVLDELPVALLRISNSGKLLTANRLAREMLGPNARMDATLPELVEGLGRSVQDWLDEALEGRGLNRTEVVRARQAEKDTYLQITLSQVHEKGDLRLMAVLNDATELKTLEAQFVQSQKMQAIGQLAGGVAHDFNNLLTAISGHCDLLLLRHDQGDPDYGDLIQINQNANRAAALVGQLLAFSRKQNLQPEIIDLPDTLADLTHLLNRLVGEKVTLSLKHDPALLPIRADKRQLEQVMMNLVVNARDAMPDGGPIAIETEIRGFSKEFRRNRAVVPAGTYVVVKVTDQGVGIEPDKLQKIFEPFFTTKRTGEGTGLGLSTAYGIVKQTGGYIFADSVLDKGSCFSLFFPAYDKPKPDLPVPEAVLPRAPLHKGEGVILLVEDEAPVRAFASRALRMRGYTVIEAENAEDALETLEDENLKVDVFVTDVIMPGMDGPSWVKKALEFRPDVKVVFVSGYAEDCFASDQASIPNSVFLPKPFSLNELTATVNDQIH